MKALFKSFTLLSGHQLLCHCQIRRIFFSYPNAFKGSSIILTPKTTKYQTTPLPQFKKKKRLCKVDLTFENWINPQFKHPKKKHLRKFNTWYNSQEIREELPQRDKENLKKKHRKTTKTNILLNGKNHNAFPLKIDTRQGRSLSTLILHTAGSSSYYTSQEKYMRHKKSKGQK